jgi:hypothetical protein
MKTDAVETWPIWTTLKDFHPKFTLSPTLDLENLLDRISIYQYRKMTFESDALNAFLGILSNYEKGPQGIQHYWGLPIVPPPRNTENMEELKIERYLAYYYIPDESLTKRFVASLTWSISGSWPWSSPRPKRRPEFPSWSWTGWSKESCDRGCRSTDVLSDVRVKVEHRNGRIQDIEGFALSGGFSLSPLHLTRFIHITARTAKVRIRHIAMEEIESEDPNSHESKSKGTDKLAWAEFLRRDGLSAYSHASLAGEHMVEPTGEYTAILLASRSDDDNDWYVLSLVDEGLVEVERIGSVRVFKGCKSQVFFVIFVL